MENCRERLLQAKCKRSHIGGKCQNGRIFFFYPYDLQIKMSAVILF